MYQWSIPNEFDYKGYKFGGLFLLISTGWKI